MAALKSYVMVSGATGGIGSALCHLLKKNDYIPIVCYRSGRSNAKKLAIDCGGFAISLDLSSDASILTALEELNEKLKYGGTLSSLVLAASPPPNLLPFGQLTSEMLMEQYRVNVIGPQLLLAGIVKNHFRKIKNGSVIGLLSTAIGSAERPPSKGMGAYVIAKIALRGMLEVCASEFPWLRVRSVTPDFTDTPMLKVFDDRYLDQMRLIAPFSTANEVAECILNEIMQ